MRFGAFLVFIGIGSAILHFTDIQFRIVMWAEPWQPGLGFGIGAVGVIICVLIIMFRKDKEAPATTQPAMAYAPPPGYAPQPGHPPQQQHFAPQPHFGPPPQQQFGPPPQQQFGPPPQQQYGPPQQPHPYGPSQPQYHPQPGYQPPGQFGPPAR